MSFIYVLQNRVTKKFYVGQTRQTVQERLQSHIHKADNNGSGALYDSMRKHGPDNFLIYAIYPTTDEQLNQCEIEKIKEYDSIAPHGYNLQSGGSRIVPILKKKKPATYKDFLSEAFMGRPNTVKTKTSLFKNHIYPYLDRGLEAKDLLNLCFHKWKEDELSVGTVRSCQAILKEYILWKFKITSDTKKLWKQYCSEVSPPVVEVKSWSKEEVKKAVSTCLTYDNELYSLLVVTLETGLRKGELFGLTWGDVDFINQTIKVTKSLDLATKKIGPTKNRRPRIVPMTNIVAEIFETGYTVGVPDSDFCFKPSDPNFRLGTLCRRANVREISWHGLRHTFSTTALEANFSPKWVSTILGHSKLSTTLDMYWSLLQEKQTTEGMYE